MSEKKYEKVADDAPNRCQGITAYGQCQFASVAGGDRCLIHGGSIIRANIAKADQRRYRLAIWQDRVDELADDDKIKSLNDEVGILRMTLEQVLLGCKNTTEMFLYAPKIADLVGKIERLVTTLHKLEASTGSLITRKAAFELAGKIVDIVGKHTTNLDAVSRIVTGHVTDAKLALQIVAEIGSASADAVALIADEIGKAVADIKSEEIDL